MPLTMAPSGTVTTVKKIHGKDETRRFLESLGFVEGGKVTVVSEMGGNLIVNIKEMCIRDSLCAVCRQAGRVPLSGGGYVPVDTIHWT